MNTKRNQWTWRYTSPRKKDKTTMNAPDFVERPSLDLKERSHRYIGIRMKTSFARQDILFKVGPYWL